MKTWSMMLAGLVLAMGATLVMAEGAEHKGNNVRGAITAIDTTAKTITVQPKAMGDAAAPAAKTFAYDDKTVVTAGTPTGDKKAISDLAVKDNVAVKLSEDGKTAVAIILNPTGQGKKPGGDKK